MVFLGRKPCSVEVRQSKETSQKVRQADCVISTATAQAIAFLGRRPCSVEVQRSKETSPKVRQADFVISMATAQAITWQRQVAPSTEQASHGLLRAVTLLRRSSTEQRNVAEREASRLCNLHGHRTSHHMTETEQARHGLLRAAPLLR